MNVQRCSIEKEEEFGDTDIIGQIQDRRTGVEEVVIISIRMFKLIHSLAYEHQSRSKNNQLRDQTRFVE